MSQENLEKLEKLIRLTTTSMTRDDFLEAFQGVIDFVKKAEVDLGSKMDEKTRAVLEDLQALNDEYKQTIKRIEDENSSSLSNLKKKASDRISDFLVKSNLNKRLNEKLGQVDTRLEEVNKIVEDVVEGMNDRILEVPNASVIALEASKMASDELSSLIPDKVNLEKELPLMGEPIRDALEELKGKDRLDKSAIKGLITELKELRLDIIKVGSQVVGGGGSGGRIVKAHDLSGSLNGVLKTFTLPTYWRIISIHSSSFPRAFRETVDYVPDPSNSQITFTSEISANSTLAAGQTLIITYSE